MSTSKKKTTKTTKKATAKGKMTPCEALFCISVVLELLYSLFNITSVFGSFSTTPLKYGIIVFFVILNALLFVLSIVTRKDRPQSKAFCTAAAFYLNFAAFFAVAKLVNHIPFADGKFFTLVIYVIIITAFDALYLYLAQHRKYAFITINSIIYTIFSLGAIFGSEFSYILVANAFAIFVACVVIPLIMNEIFIRFKVKETA